MMLLKIIGIRGNICKIIEMYNANFLITLLFGISSSQDSLSTNLPDVPHQRSLLPVAAYPFRVIDEAALYHNGCFGRTRGCCNVRTADKRRHIRKGCICISWCVSVACHLLKGSCFAQSKQYVFQTRLLFTATAAADDDVGFSTGTTANATSR